MSAIHIRLPLPFRRTATQLAACVYRQFYSRHPQSYFRNSTDSIRSCRPAVTQADPPQRACLSTVESCHLVVYMLVQLKAAIHHRGHPGSGLPSTPSALTQVIAHPKTAARLVMLHSCWLSMACRLVCSNSKLAAPPDFLCIPQAASHKVLPALLFCQEAAAPSKGDTASSFSRPSKQHMTRQTPVTNPAISKLIQPHATSSAL